MLGMSLDLDLSKDQEVLLTGYAGKKECWNGSTVIILEKLEKEETKTKGVSLTPSGKYKAINRGIYISTFDTKEAATHAFNLALGKTKEQLKQELQEIKEQAI